eukprot:CAMPEP_0119410884 /NCGR_PEP_ID=MMETSP1335-20130426/3778_1 /TAXON_ID=259385 /ORGANISM="Chrysoculter rhomboideus, Strain RCC1486" /LENGTH=270 /DNA_ID=CAMNT_0007435475 /DNA_START=35 /DNA_END=847 /DNA_ORIENTATION=-
MTSSLPLPADAEDASTQAFGLAFMTLNDRDLMKVPRVCRKWRYLVDDPSFTGSRVAALRSTPPLYVDPVNGSDDNFGTEASPLRSAQRAESLLHARGLKPRYPNALLMAFVVRCHPSVCEVRQCAVAKCESTVCIEHGNGQGCIGDLDEGESMFYQGHNFCRELGCKVVCCSEHRDFLDECELCRDKVRCEVALGCYNPEDVPRCSYEHCDRHLRVCYGFDSDDEDDSNDDPDTDDRRPRGRECGLRLCNDCYEEHRRYGTCGFLPSEGI